MRALLQRVRSASVDIGGKRVGRIEKGLLVLLGVTHSDDKKAADWLAGKVGRLRIFEDETGKMNLSVADVKGGLLVVSQFTLYADATQGNRPSFIDAARPEIARPLVDSFVQALSQFGPVETGEFGADMQVSLVNDGPVTILLESPV